MPTTTISTNPATHGHPVRDLVLTADDHARMSGRRKGGKLSHPSGAAANEAGDLEMDANRAERLLAAVERISAAAGEAAAQLREWLAPILSDDERGTRSVRTPPGEVHGVTVEQLLVASRRTFRAVCLCGWRSTLELSRPKAVEAGSEHAR